jgi:hypothetical protein
MRLTAYGVADSRMVRFRRIIALYRRVTTAYVQSRGQETNSNGASDLHLKLTPVLSWLIK